MTQSYHPDYIPTEDDIRRDEEAAVEEALRLEEQKAAQEREMLQKEEGLANNVAEMEAQQSEALTQPEEGEPWIGNTGIGGYENPGASMEAITNVTREAAEGLIDTALGLGSLMDKANPFGDPFSWVKDKWDKANPISQEEPMHKMVRKISGVAIPSLYGGGLLSGAARSTAMWGQLGGKGKLLTDIAAHLSADLVITTASTSATDENLAAMLNENFGTQIDWATKSTDSTEVKYWKQMFDTAGLSVGADLVSVLFGFAKYSGKGTKYTANTPEGAELLAKRDIRTAELVQEASMSPEMKALQDQVEALGSLGDDLTSAGEEELAGLLARMKQLEVDELPFKEIDELTDPKVDKYLTKQLQTEEGIRRLEADPLGVKGYDPFINTPSNPVSTAVRHANADPVTAVTDLAEIKKYPTLNQRPAPIVTEHFQKDFMKAADGTERAAKLHDLYSTMPKQIDAIRDGKVLSADDMKKAVDNLTSSILGTDIKKFAKDLNSLKTNIQNGQKFLDDETFIALSQAFRQAFDDIYDPNNIRAASVMVNQAANTVSDASRVANSMGDFFDVTRQTEIAFDNLELVATELRANQYIAGYSLEAKKLVKSTKDNPRVAIKLAEHRAAFEEGLRLHKEQARQTIASLKDITSKNPELRKAFTMAFDASNGDVNTLEKLYAFANENIGLMRTAGKMFYDTNPKIPSLILKGLNGVRYNSVLSGKAFMRAAFGNATVMTAKPISALVGSAPKAIAGDAYQFKRALASYGGFMEAITRARKVLANDWQLAVSNPQEAMRRGRADLNFESDTNLEILNEMKEGLRSQGKTGKVALINIAQQLSNFNNNPIPRFGINAMFAIDGFTNSMMASVSARARAYDELFEATNGAFKRSDFDKLQNKLYDEAFDVNGVLTDKAAKHASSEIALNLDNDLVNSLQVVMDRVPATKALFMFMRTGLNALELMFSYTPVSNLPLGISKAQRLFKASTDNEILESLAEHGIDKMDPIAFQALKSEHVGRQIMGAGLITGAGLWAVNGNLTGNGPQDAAERRRMMEMGWKELSIRNPFTGQWHSYKGFEPFQGILGTVADVVYHAKRVDQSVQEDILQKLLQAIQLNVTNSTFMSGFEPLVAMQAGDESAWARFTANNVNSLIPFSGARGLLSQIITPQIKDVENEWQYHLANRNKFLFNDDVVLPDAIDIYTGEPIKYYEPLTAAVNALLPAFKSNGGMEPWRQWLLDTGWDNLQILQINPLSKEPIDPKTQQWINNWIGTKYPLVKRIEEMMNHPKEYWDKQITAYTKGRGELNQRDFPIKQFVVHRHLDELHRKARKAAWQAYKKTEEGKAAVMEGAYREDIKQRLRRGDVKGAKERQKQLVNIINIAK